MPIEKKNAESRFSVMYFVAIIAASLAGFLVLLSIAAPATWKAQMDASFLAIFGVFLVVHFLNAFMEYVFHRWVLHAPLIPFLSYFYKRHRLHHALTHVAMTKAAGESRIANRYPIVDEAQHQASFFPSYTFLVFGVLWTPFFALAQWLLPEAPIFLGGFIAIGWSISLYEVLHMIEHLPLEKWQSLFDHPRFGRWWRMLYAFHLRHHADPGSNEAVSGFFGLPLADLVFGTLVVTEALYPDGTIAQPNDFTPKIPRLIRFLDRWAERARGRK